MYGSHGMRHTGFRRLRVVNRTLGKLVVTNSHILFFCPIFICFCETASLYELFVVWIMVCNFEITNVHGASILLSMFSYFSVVLEPHKGMDRDS